MANHDQPHVIRLRGPWQITREHVDRSPVHEASVEVTYDVRLPARTGDFVSADFRGRIELRRNFNWPEFNFPGPVGYRESLWLVIQAAAWPQFSVELNAQPLGTVAGFRELPAAWEITSLVATHNQLQLNWNIDAAGLLENLSWVDVQLEVRLDVGPSD